MGTYSILKLSEYRTEMKIEKDNLILLYSHLVYIFNYFVQRNAHYVLKI